MMRDLRSWARSQSTPATLVLVGLLAASFLASWFSQGKLLGPDLAFYPNDWLNRAWTLVSYPFGSQGNFFGVLFSCWWLWGIGGSIEREIGSARMAEFWLATSAIGALSFLLGFLLIGEASVLFGPYIPLSAVTVAWGTRNPNAQLLFMFVIPITGKWLAWISAGLVFFGTNNPKMALFAVVPLALAYLYASDRLPGLSYGGGRSSRRPTDGRGKFVSKQYLDDVKKREKEREERDRLRRLFENSLQNDQDPDR